MESQRHSILSWLCQLLLPVHLQLLQNHHSPHSFNAPWNFDSKCCAAFDKLKEEFTHAPLLTHWVPDSQIMVETDASDYALATILSIHSSDGEIHPIAFHSCSFNPTELNYDTHDKELLTIFEAFKHWCQYLEGSGTLVDMVTDHKNLEYFTTTKLLTRHQARWSEFLSQFNMIIRFRPRKLGAKPDALTRRWDIYHKGVNSDFALANPSTLHSPTCPIGLRSDCSESEWSPIGLTLLYWTYTLRFILQVESKWSPSGPIHSMLFKQFKSYYSVVTSVQLDSTRIGLELTT
jgi:hypothetical protein